MDFLAKRRNTVHHVLLPACRRQNSHSNPIKMYFFYNSFINYILFLWKNGYDSEVLQNHQEHFFFQCISKVLKKNIACKQLKQMVCCESPIASCNHESKSFFKLVKKNPFLDYKPSKNPFGLPNSKSRKRRAVAISNPLINSDLDHLLFSTYTVIESHQFH